MTGLCLHHLQSSEHFQTGHAAPTHPLPRGLGIHEEAVRAVFSPEWAQLSSAQQGPLQSGLSALRGQIQCGRRVNIWIWTPTGPQQHVGFPFTFLRLTLYVFLPIEVMKTVATIVVLSNWFTEKSTYKNYENAQKQVFYNGGEITYLNHLKSHLITWTEFIAIIKSVHYVFHSTQKHQ